MRSLQPIRGKSYSHPLGYLDVYLLSNRTGDASGTYTKRDSMLSTLFFPTAALEQ